MTNLGELDTLVTVQEVKQTIGDRGQKKNTVVRRQTVFAHLERTTSEMIDDGNLESVEIVDLTMYKIPGLTTRWQLVLAGVPYEITAIDPISRMSDLMTVTARTIKQ